MITLGQFKATAGQKYDDATLTEVYDKLAGYARNGIIAADEVARYAKFKWCLKDKYSLVAYETDKGWQVNNCDDAIEPDMARLKINGIWGFEASRIKIIGTPYYCATDWHFVVFECMNVVWLWKNKELYQLKIYE